MFLVRALEAVLMRVPRPAAGIITTTFMAGCQYTGRDAGSSNHSVEGPAECIRSCVRHGAKYMLVDGEANYILAGSPAVLDSLAGQRARIQGTLDGAVLSVTAAVAQVDSAGRTHAP